MTNLTDTQKLEYLIPRLKAGMKLLFTNGRWQNISIVDLERSNIWILKNIDLDATAAANEIQWPLTIGATATPVRPESPRMFTAEEMEQYSNYSYLQGKDGGPVLNINSWLASKQKEKLTTDIVKEINDVLIKYDLPVLGTRSLTDLCEKYFGGKTN